MSALADASGVQLAGENLRVRHAVLTLAVIAPLLYVNDGDPYRAYEVVGFGMLVLTLAFLCRDRLVVRRSAVNLWIALIILYIAMQPLLGAGEPAYNLKYALALAMCFAPLLALQTLGPYGSDGLRHCRRVLDVVFVIIALNIAISYLSGAGEVYEGSGLLQRRAFGWVGDSIGPAVVFYAFYYHAARRRLAFAVTLLCLLMMQAKMSILMMLLGGALLFVLRNRHRKGVLLSGLAVMLLLAVSARWWLGALTSVAINNLDYTINNRLFSYAAGVVYFLQSPIVGVGANRTYSMLLAGFDVTSLASYSEGAMYYGFLQIQNAYLRTAAELGLVGLLMFLGLCVGIIQRSLRVLLRETRLPNAAASPLAVAAALWLVSFILFHHTTGWFEAGSPQLAWLVSIWSLLTCVRHEYDLRAVLG